MSASIVNFSDLKVRNLTQKAEHEHRKWRQQTVDFARHLNDLPGSQQIDPVHQATLLMAKAIDVLSQAGPVPSSIDDQHARAGNLLHSVFRARKDMLEKSVRIICAENISSQILERDELSI